MRERLLDGTTRRRAGRGVVLWLLVGWSLAIGLATAAEQLVVQPNALELAGRDPFHGVLVATVTSDGVPTDVTRRSRFTSLAPAIFTVSSNGQVHALADGRGELEVAFGSSRRRVPVTVSGSGALAPPSFRQDIKPILTRAGCNMGGCHGKLAGQNGFRLSLRGYAPEWDHDWLTTEVRGRRLNYDFPEDSLLVLKPLMLAPHEGGQRFEPGSRYHRMLVDWIAARAPGPATNELDCAELEVLPGTARTLGIGGEQPLLVRAHYTDGRVRDVTWLAQFFSNDEATAKVTPDGVVKVLRSGATAIRIHFQGQVAVMMVTSPYTNVVNPADYVAHHNALDPPLFAKLQQLRIPPSPPADDATFLRRAMLDACGTLPTAEQVQVFLADTNAAKRVQLVDQLLASPEFTDYWTLQLADLLQNRKERDHDVRGSKGVRAFYTWLRGQVAANRPWNELARAVLTASGDVADHPEIGYFIYNLGEKQNVEESDTPDAVAQAFLGTRIGCARCHNHPLEKYTQDDFYHFAAFFGKMRMKRAEPDKGLTALLLTTREEEDQKKRVEEAAKKFAEFTNSMAQATAPEAEKLRKKMPEEQKRFDEARLQLQKVSARIPTVTQPRTKRPMLPQVLDRTPLELPAGSDPRDRLAAWVTSPTNHQFSGALANRLWKHFFGIGLVEPVDDLRASNPPSNPELWRVLNAQVVRRGYDLRQLMRLILNSRAYQLAGTTTPGNASDRKFFSHYYARRLPAEVLSDAMSLATGVPDEFKGYPLGTRATQLPEPGVASYFLSLFGRSERVTACACERNGEVTLPQLLHLNNGEEIVNKIKSPDGRLAALLKENPDDATAVNRIFLTVLSRAPRPAEVAAVARELSAGAKRDEVFQDLVWALLNTKEFAFNH